MKVKRYLGETMQDAIFKVKTELGSDAIILHTRKIKEGGFFGFFGKKLVEIIAAVDSEKDFQFANEFRDEINTLKDRIQELTKEKSLVRVVANNNLAHLSQILYPGKLQKYSEKMICEGVMVDITTNICDRVMNQLEVHQLHDDDAVYHVLQDEIGKIIKPCPSIESYQSRRVIAFVGPTGVGKTTTIAKLAALIALKGNKKIGLITADTYRIAAVEQLKTYSDIINVPIRVIYDSEELGKALQEFAAYDLILIDTAGRSQKNINQMDQLKELLKKDLINEIHLVVAMNTPYEDIVETVQNFGELYLTSIILTKQDESSKKGVILNVLECTNHQVSYITFGQDVPEDIRLVEPKDIAEMILKGSSE